MKHGTQLMQNGFLHGIRKTIGERNKKDGLLNSRGIGKASDLWNRKGEVKNTAQLRGNCANKGNICGEVNCFCMDFGFIY